MSDKPKIFVTSDNHFLHSRIVLTRPTYHSVALSSIIFELANVRDDGLLRDVVSDLQRDLAAALLPCMAQMHQDMIINWNSVIRPQDVVYHLGDFAMSWGKKTSWDPIAEILDQLNGQKFLITGNHDRDEVTKQPHWQWVRPYHELKLDLGGAHKQRVVLSHYAHRVWNQMHRGAWMLHGHSHNNLPDIGGKIVDVGVDAWGMRPVEMRAIKIYMSTRPIVASGDHHNNQELKIT